MKKKFQTLTILIGLLIVTSFRGTGFNSAEASPNGFITFEDGTDGAVISSTIPGLEFTNTNGQDWLYADCSTGNYNCPYPDGAYIVHGNIGAWLGASQGDGRIDLTSGNATYLSVWVSAGEPIQLIGYDSNDQVIGTDNLDAPNTNTGQMAQLVVNAPAGSNLSYAIVSGVGNYWVMDDLATDADGVPDTRNPLIFVPGVTGSRMENDPNGDGAYDELWPNWTELAWDPDDDSLLVLRLAADGVNPFGSGQEYTSIRVGDIIRMEGPKDFYHSTVEFFTSPGQGYVEGENFFVCPYDWRKSLSALAAGTLDNTLDKCVDEALAQNPDASQVNILAHSMGGLVSRYYIADASNAQKVQRLITLGTPYLGAPKIAMATIDGLCFMQIGWCWTNVETLYELLQNYPAAYEISPSDDYFQVYPNGYIRRDYDADGDGSNDGYLNPDTSFDILEDHNTNLAQSARLLQSTIGGWGNGGTNGVQVSVFVGDQHDAIGTIVEYEKRPWYNPWAEATIAYKTELTNGDGTVPLHSADMRNLPNGVDLSGGVSIFYFDLNHGELPINDQVLQFASVLFTSSPSTNINQLYAPELNLGTSQQISSNSPGLLRDKNTDAQSLSPSYIPRTEPLPLNGRYISFEGPVEIEIYDSAGNRVGIVNDGGAMENLIPGASYYVLGTSTFIFLPDSDVYEVKVHGQQDASTDIRIQKIIDDELTQTDLYDDLPVTENSVAMLDYDPISSVAGDFALDQDGDGDYDTSFPPSETLDGTESQDFVSPSTTITLDGEMSPEGWFIGEVTVTLQATDDEGGTGVAKIEYSTDGGATIHTYTGPFTVDAETVSILLAKATDRAGNEEAPLAFARVGPEKIYLPLVNKK